MLRHASRHARAAVAARAAAFAARTAGAALVALATLATGCASAPEHVGEFDAPVYISAEPMTIEVLHNMAIATSLTVYLIAPGSAPRRLGRVTPGETARLELRQVTASIEYSIYVEAPDGRSAQSRPFTLDNTSGVRWDIAANTITRFPPRED
jgi:anti-sigma-K factor RskA